jgi:hypothetical protein
MQSRCKAAEREDWYRSRREILGQQNALLIENHLKIRNKAVAQQQQPAVYTQMDKHRLLD